MRSSKVLYLTPVLILTLAAIVPVHAKKATGNRPPAALQAKGDLLKIPAGYAIRWQGVILAQSPNIVRDFTLTQYDENGAALQSKTIHYEGPNDTGVDCGRKAGCELPVTARRTWIATSYPLSRTSLVTQSGRVHTRAEVFGKQEAYVTIAFAKNPRDLPAIKLP